MIKFKNIYADGVDYFVALEETAGLSVGTKQRHNILKRCHSVGCATMVGKTSFL